MKHRRAKSSGSKTLSSSLPSSANNGHTRSSSDHHNPASFGGRSRSGSNAGSLVDAADVELETDKRRKRDRILHRVSRQRASDTADIQRDGKQVSSTGYDTPVPRTGERPAHEAGKSDGGRHTGGAVDEGEMEDDDVNTGQYVNYQVGFKYERTASASKKGWGLHMLVGPGRLPVRSGS
jgi:hypothetical protein